MSSFLGISADVWVTCVGALAVSLVLAGSQAVQDRRWRRSRNPPSVHAE